MQKRGQVTIYVILGIIILIAILLLVNYRDIIFQSQFERQQRSTLDVPEQAKDIQIQVTQCLEQTADEAALLLGLQGGYINLPEDTLPRSPSNPFSNSITLGNANVAYWFYETANGIQKKQIPTIDTMEFQMGEYIDNNFVSCIRRVIENEDAEFEIGTPITDVQIEEDNIQIISELDFVMRKGTFVFTFPDFYAQLNYKLGAMHKLAQKIIESEDNYLEEKTIDYLVLYDEIPYSGTSLECNKQIWTKSQVKQSLKEVLFNTVPQIKIAGTDNSNAAKYDTWDIGSVPSNVNANFRFFKSWPIQMEVFPSDGEILQADQFNKQIGNEALAFLTSLFCITNYQFAYDIKYPMIIELKDDKGYVFQVAKMVIIDNNQPLENVLGDFEPLDVKSQICDKASIPITVGVKVETASGMQPVNDAAVSYKCINEVCELGRTEGGNLVALAPACVNGFVIAKKDGLHRGKEMLSTNEPGSISVIMDKIYDLDYEIKVIDGGIERSPLTSEQITLYLTEEDKDYTTSVAGVKNKISLISGNYKVKAYLVEESPFDITVQGKEIEKCVDSPRGILGIFGFEEEKCYTTEIPDMKLNTLVKGGGEVDWTVTASELANSEKVTFYVEAQEAPIDYDELTDLFNSVEEQLLPSPKLR